MIGSPLQNSLLRDNKKKGRVFNKVYVGTFRFVYSPLIYIYLVYEHFIKTLKIMSISPYIHRPYEYGSLCSYISPVNSSIDPLTLIG